MVCIWSEPRDVTVGLCVSNISLMDTPPCIPKFQPLIRVLHLPSLWFPIPSPTALSFCFSLQRSHLLMAISLLIELNPSFYVCHYSLLSAQLITSLHLATSLSHSIFISSYPHHACVTGASIHASSAFFLFASFHNLPFPPSPLMLPFINHITFPLNALIITPIHLCISLDHCPCTFLCVLLFVHLIWPHQTCAFITPLSNVHVALYPSMFVSHYFPFS